MVFRAGVWGEADRSIRFFYYIPSRNPKQSSEHIRYFSPITSTRTLVPRLCLGTHCLGGSASRLPPRRQHGNMATWQHGNMGTRGEHQALVPITLNSVRVSTHPYLLLWLTSGSKMRRLGTGAYGVNGERLGRRRSVTSVCFCCHFVLNPPSERAGTVKQTRLASSPDGSEESS